MEINKIISFSKSFKNDYYLVLSFSLFIVSLLMGLVFLILGIINGNTNYTILFGMNQQMVFAIVCLLLVLIFTLSFYKRIKSIVRMFKIGILLNAKIIEVFRFKDRGRFEYEYFFNGEKIKSFTAIHKSKMTKEFLIGDEIEILVDPIKNKNSIIKILYEK